MKNYILLLLLATFGMQAQTYQNPTYGKLKLKTNTESTTATKVNVQETDGSINWQFIKDFQNNKPYFSTGLLKNGLLTINADNTKFDLSAGIGVYSDFSDPENVTSKVFNFPAFSAVVSPYIATSNITYVAINYNGGSPILVMQAAPFSNTQMRDLVVVGAVIHSNFTTINVINNISSPSNDVGNSVADLFNFLGARNQEGNVYSANGANLQLNKSAGVILKYGANFHVNAKNPHNVSLPEQLSLTFRYRLQGGFEGTDRINVDVDNFDSNNVLTTVPPAKPYQIQTIFIPQTGQTRIQYGQTTYNTLADAIAAINTRKFNVETNLATQFVKVAYLVVKKGTTSLQVVADSDIIQASKFDATASGGVAITYQSIIDALGFVPENVANKVIDISTGANNTTYPSSLAVKTYADNLVVGMLNDRGTWDASVNLFPTTGGSGTAGAIRKGDMWYVSVAGILGGKSVNVGDSFRALVNSPAQTASNWSVLEANIGYVPENVANKTSGFSSSSTTTYPNSTALVDGLATKQSTLVSGTSIKTIEGQNILGSGNIDITKTDVELGNVDNTSDVNKPISTAAQTALNGKVSLAGAETITGVKTLSPSVSASSALARGTIVTPTLTATANNDVLVGLDVAPTFTNGAFTGISNYAAKVNGLSWFTNTIYISGPAISTNTYYRNDYIDTYGSVGFKLKSNLGGLSLNSAGTGNIDLETAGSIKGRMFNTTGNLILQNGGIYADNGVDRVQVNGTISASPATLSNQVVIKSQLDLKADLSSPALTGTPTAPTVTAGTNTTQVATTAFVQANKAIEKTYSEIQSLISSSLLIKGQVYLLTDYITTYTQPVTGLSKSSGIVEQLYLTVTEVNKLSNIAHSKLYPQDVVYYEITGDIGNGKGTEGFTKGKIYRRIDTKRNNDIGTDWRHVKYDRLGTDKLLFENYDIEKVSNNIIKTYYLFNNVFEADFYDNNVGSEFKDNTFGSQCYSNTIGDYFQGNTVLEGFSSNKTGDFFKNNNIGEFYSNNKSFDYFQGNTIGDNSFQNTFKSGFANNILGFNFNNNNFENEVKNINLSAYYIRFNKFLVSQLPVLTLSNIGQTLIVTDALSPTYLGTLTGGGSVVCPVFWNGTDWIPTIGDSRPYKVYTALISQSGTDAPTVNSELENTLGGTVTFERESAGVYEILLNGSPLSSSFLKIYPNLSDINPAGGNTYVSGGRIFSYDISSTVSDGLLYYQSYEIRVYN